MSSFDSWLDGRPPTDAEAVDLLQARSALGPAWPAGSDGWAAYATAIAGSTAVADKGHALASLERAWRRFAPATDMRGFWQTIAGWVSNVYFWAVLLGGGIIFVLFSHALDKEMLDRLARPEQARGLITFLFAVATVGIALVIVLAVFLSTGGKEEVSERFQMGKDVLALLMGVFGTILGFYFGSEIASGRQPAVQQVTAPAPPATNN
jgi:hypothetical protein